MPNVTLDGVPQKLYRYDVDDTPVNGVIYAPPSSNWAYDHAADPDAHSYNPFEKVHLEHFLMTPLAIGGDNITIVANELYATPYPIAVERTTSHIAINVTTGAVGKVARLGLYADNGSCYPGALVGDSGEFSVADIELSTNVFVYTVGPGLYWAALLSDGTPTVTKATYMLILSDRDAAVPSFYGGISKTSYAYAALPATFPAGAGIAYKGTGQLLRFSA